MDRRRLEQIERYVLGFFQAQGRARVLANELFDSTGEFANADLVRALEDLEKKQRLLVRHTTEGFDYISLTRTRRCQRRPPPGGRGRKRRYAAPAEECDKVRS